MDVSQLLPSVRFEGDDAKPVGFVIDVTREYADAASAVLQELADVFVEPPVTRSELRICFHSARYVPALPFQLYSFSIVSFDEAGEAVDGFVDGEEFRFAFVVNQPLEVQREAALACLYEMLFRHAAVTDPGADANKADMIAAQAGERGQVEFRDRIRSGWRAAAQSLAARASHDGLALSVRYQRDPFPDRASLARRSRALRETYNNIPLAREFIDKTVSLIGGRDPRVTAGDPEVQAFVERYFLETGLRHVIAQATRDAQALGNGYLVSPDSPDGAPWNLRPEDVEIDDDHRYLVMRNGKAEFVASPVLHVPGVRQFDSPYGFSVLEAILPEWIGRKTLRSIVAQTEQLALKHPDSQQLSQYIEDAKALVDRHQQASDERINRLLQYPRDWIPGAVADLYISGQGRL